MHKPVLQLIGGNVLSKILGAAREVLMAALFGTGASIGAFRVAQTGTLAPVHFFTSDSCNAAFIPLYKKYLSQSLNKARTLLWGLLALFLFLSLLLVGFLWALSTPWVEVIAPGLDLGVAAISSDMLRVMAIGTPFYIFSAVLMFLCMGNDDFVPTAFRPSVQNLGLICGVFAAFMLRNMVLLAWGFTISYIAFSVWLVHRAMSAGFLAFPEVWLWPEFREVMLNFWLTLRPLMFLPLMLQGNIVIERLVASLIGIVSVSSLDYAKFISETLMFLVAFPLAQVGLSRWSSLENREIKKRLKKTLFLISFVAMPVSAFLAVNAGLVVEVLYARGAFDAKSVSVTSEILFGISLGLWAQAAGYVLIKALNAQLCNAAVFRIMVIALLANGAFNLVLYPYLGPLTLGIGNTVYGIILYAGTLHALDLWADAFETCWGIVLGCLGYFFLNSMIPLFDTVWENIAIFGGFALVYWFILSITIPRWRAEIIELVSASKR